MAIISQYSQAIILNTLTLHSAVCQLYPNKTGEKEALPHIGYLFFLS